jgi:ABC-type Mn2+/Zn2+ transport system permease subunit
MIGAFSAAVIGPFADLIMQRALLEVTLVGVCGGALGCWVIFYGLSYASESLAHGLFPGLVAAALLSLPLLLGAGVGILVAALGVAVASRIPGVGRNVAVAVVVTFLFGLGVLLALSPDSPPGIQGLLFGDVLGATDSDLALSGGLTVGIVATLLLLHARLLAVGFDRAFARSLGISPVAADAAVLSLLAGAILVGVQGMGNLLVVAVLVGPAATARQLSSRMKPMMLLSVAVAVLAGAAGLCLSYYAGTAAGASVAAAFVVAYLVAMFSRRTGLPLPVEEVPQ